MTGLVQSAVLGTYNVRRVRYSEKNMDFDVEINC